jgi:hypothetical protein
MRTKSSGFARDCFLATLAEPPFAAFMMESRTGDRAQARLQKTEANACCGVKLSRLPTVKRTHSAYPCSFRNICSLCGPLEAMQPQGGVELVLPILNSSRSPINSMRFARKTSEPGLSVSWLRRHGTRGSVQSRTGPLLRCGAGINSLLLQYPGFADASRGSLFQRKMSPKGGPVSNTR